jgi:hypothetical protein
VCQSPGTRTGTGTSPICTFARRRPNRSLPGKRIFRHLLPTRAHEWRPDRRFYDDPWLMNPPCDTRHTAGFVIGRQRFRVRESSASNASSKGRSSQARWLGSPWW